MPTIAELNQRHPCINETLQADLKALYQGDEALEARLTTFLPQREREEATRYKLRRNEFHYRNYLGAIIDYFAAMLFTSKPSATAKNAAGEDVAETDPYFARLREDCDRQGGDIDAFFKGRITDAMIYQRAWFTIEQPSDGGEKPTDKAQFEKRGLGDYWLRSLEQAAVLDWDHAPDGSVAWVLVHSRTARRASLGGNRDMVTDTWEHYLPERVDTYAITYDTKKKPPETTEVPKVGTRAHSLGRVPVLCLQLPLGLWAANRLKTPQLAHFRALNAQSWSLSMTCYAMPVAKVSDPAEFAKAAAGAGYGIVIGQEDSWEWEAPPTGHFAALDTEIKAHKDEIFRIAHQMALGVENNATAVGRTAESKSQDAQSTRVILTAYGRIVKETIELVYDLISAARGESLTWSIGGLDDFASVDTNGFITMVADLEKAGGIPSQSFNADLKYKLATSVLPDTDEARKQTYKQEIEKNTPDPAEDAALEREATLALLKGAGSSERPGQGAAKGPGPTKPAEA